MEGEGVLVFLKKFGDPNLELATKIAKSWDASHVEANGIRFKVSEKAIARITGLFPMEVKITQEHHSLWQVELFRGGTISLFCYELLLNIVWLM